MTTETPIRNDDLHDIIDERITALVREMEQVDWRAEEVVTAIDDVIKARWLPRFEALHQTRDAQPKGFISDGNEG